jgi:G3E family GTPase
VSPIPVTLVTGFLGSGKTTVLNHLVRTPEMAKALVIINEFGEIGLDHLLVTQGREDTVVEMSSGCLCCTIRSSLAKTLRDVTWRFAREGKRQFDRVLIETTGLADPAPIINTLITDKFIASRYRLDGVVTTVDLASGGRTLDEHPESIKQAAVADLVLLTKADLASREGIAKLHERLARLNPVAPQHIVRSGQVEPAMLLDLGSFDAAGKIADVRSWLGEEAAHATVKAAHRHDADGHPHEHRNGHDVNRHDDHIRAFCFALDGPIQPGALEAWREAMQPLMGESMLRIKGILNVRGEACPVVVHGVQHILHPEVHLPQWPTNDRRSRMVFITRNIERNVIEQALKTLTTAPEGGGIVDRP